ncbi:type II secretion system F family protein [Chitinimonas viridis]|uniref:Type II secretion system F family protein n=1 Tax=Chitinimonas viridis TaxID=664880 RepID=A0ABT8BBL9_9NEIS|nr:type II secretion system F family protein [Chitinimonas viridis]MDN3578966.1 type II secretion system F family protein [Chitinimonas viridis]
MTLLLGLIFLVTLITAWLVYKAVQGYLDKQRASIELTTATTLADMFIFLDPQKMFRYNVALTCILPPIVWVLTGNPVFAFGALIATVFLPKWYVGFLGRRRLKRLEQQLPDALLMVSGAMRAGASLNVSLESMVKESKPPVSQEFELMLREQRLGVDFDTALQNMERRNPQQDFQLVISAMRISKEVGGNLAEILESLAGVLRDKAIMEGKIRSLTAQGKAQGVIMTGLPILMMLALRAIEPKAMEPLFNTWIGYGTLTVIIVMELVGYWFIRKITTIDV